MTTIEDEEFVSLQQIMENSIKQVTSDMADVQLYHLKILESIGSGSDEALKTELGNAGVIATMTKILNGCIAKQKSSARTIIHSRILATTIIWVVTIAHVDNKLRSEECVVVLLQQIRYFIDILEDREGIKIASPDNFDNCLEIIEARKADIYLIESMICVSLRALWSICYGITRNQELLLINCGIPLIIRLLKLAHASFEIKFNVAGVLWHVSALHQAAMAIIAHNPIPYLIDMVHCTDHPARDTFVACLALAALINADESSQISTQSVALEAISQWIEMQNVTEFKSLFVWTTLQPLVSLLESKYGAVNELGCFMVVAEICNESEISKMFTEGIVDLLKKFAVKGNDACRHLAGMALSRLRIDVDELKRTQLQTPNHAGNLLEWLQTIGLQSLTEILEKHEITLENVQYLTCEDLEKIGILLGPRKKLYNAIHSLIRQSEGNYLKPNMNSDGSCLICFEAAKEICFVPCGHVVTCKQCAQITIARRDKCPICRRPIEQLVKPFYV